jgi:T4 superinfection immunity protein
LFALIAEHRTTLQAGRGLYMSNFNNPAFIEWLSTVAISVGVSLIVAGGLAVWTGRLLRFDPEHKLWAFIVGFAFLCSLSTVPMSEHGTWADTLYLAMIPILIIFLYFLPTAAAINGRHPHFSSIFIMNLFFGWTIAGWMMALFWALRQPAAIEGANFRATPFGAVPHNKPRNQPQRN